MGEYVIILLCKIFIAVGIAFGGKMLFYGRGRTREDARKDLFNQSQDVEWKEKK